ncbi:pentapeptide repeat-containing protein [Methanococcoides seepicolus]|uniref:Pentapeptide repeat-containing protein n=1 Tax=Methanococcoides seepicolus TaxID=2828780 RepID=A0A9E4ZGN3_9EURY|nr:pentapeptide repeat-containing protein [Methanococcoides seepicolus]MCM1987555.1 pentapeptide repeat-containing protein [Methanococcoides seepicolus]
MSKCQFKKESYECPLDTEEGNNLCYWHQEIKGKNPSQEKLAELTETYINFAFLQEADLSFTNLQEANLMGANLQEANLMEAKLQKTNLIGANLQEANLIEAKLQKANLIGANLQEAVFFHAKLQKADLRGAKLQKADLRNANLTKSKIENTRFDTESMLDNAILKNANLHLSYIDLAKSLRNATVFEKENLHEKEVNEKIADCKKNREEKIAYYEASKEVYNKLYHLYSDEGMDFRTKHAHYRRAEVTRKHLRVRNKWNSVNGVLDRIKSWGFDWFILKMLTGYGESILRPILISLFWITTFGLMYKQLDGVLITGDRKIQLLDYFYLSLTTFTGLGFANVQPDITVPLMQPLVMVESTFGVAMLALIIFVITYQISR